MFNMMNMFGKLNDIKEKVAETKEKFPFIEVEETHPESKVKVKVTADKKLQSIEIPEEVLAKDSREEMQQKVVEAVNNALEKAGARGKEELKKNLEGSLPDIPGLDLDKLPF